ncbi:MAG: type III-B CRISPR module-associated Cmr3 family protein, partial [Bacteroidota bacterium]
HHHALRTIPKWQNSGKKVYQVPALASSSGIKIKTSTGGQEIQSDLNLLVEYDPKLGTSKDWMNVVTRKQVSNGTFYQEVEEQIGIYKTDTLKYRKTDDREGFFKMQYKRLKEGSGFSFFVDLDKDQLDRFESQPLVIFGKERSAFKMEVLPYPSTDPIEEVEVSDLQGGETLCLLSPARLDMQEVQRMAHFIVGSEISFRCMKTRVKIGYNYYGNPRKKYKNNQHPNHPTMSGRYNLLDAGSLLFLRSSASPSDITSALQDLTFETIGYNRYTVLKDNA